MNKLKEELTANPAKKDFRRFLKQGGFRKIETFVPHQEHLPSAAELMHL
ncbi:hypothetical protein [Rufibacter roseus]|uniref:Uncharacterized protein n=1 Tax=Rufibacter roseus TaxID=1567108 RepID=A0ABW2DGN6_9BACT|nr:hypothetical protein [Rufibacter roseus]